MASINSCTNEPVQENWMSLWERGLCYDPFFRSLYSSPGAQINPSSLESARRDFVTIFQRYLSTFSLTEVGKPGYNAMQERILQVCTDLPGVCDSALTSICSRYTREQVEQSPALSSFCGCFAPELQGEIRRFLVNSSFVYDRPCDPLCSRIGTVKLATPEGNPALCTSDVCVVSNVNIDSIDSNLPFVNFTQVCSCRENCRCVFDVTNTTETLNRLGLNYSLNQFCSQGSACLEGGRIVPCVTSTEVSLPVSKTFYYILGSLVLLFLLFAFLYFFLSGR
ncbi:Transmembrane domain-containing protein [Cedratvirus Zaza IHUMI]|uniref:Transmembrane domain-containing protein n=1 Tax=Cedratvirus Zaza IHUMI TaxID=2126979 RepID=A0A2R8FD84_9VIRU|nr:Transmembrane domain-containing protein [Cedratvirus Zaza IHUMI]